MRIASGEIPSTENAIGGPSGAAELQGLETYN